MLYLFRGYRRRLPAWVRDEWEGEAGLAVLEAAALWTPERGRFSTYLYLVSKSAVLNLIAWCHRPCRRAKGNRRRLRDVPGHERDPADTAVLHEVWDDAVERDGDTARERFAEGRGVDTRNPETRRRGYRVEKLLRYLRGKYGEEPVDHRSASTRYRHKKRGGAA